MTSRGRPTKYEAEYADKAREYARGGFLKKPDVEAGERVSPFEDFCVLPTNEGLARHLGIALSTLHLWRKEFPDFSDAVEELLERQAELIINKGALGMFAPKIVGILLSNHGYVEKTETDNTHKGTLEVKTINVIGVNADNP